MNEKGTIDWPAFRADLKAISRNDYPNVQLVKLPFNWFQRTTVITPVVRGSGQLFVSSGPTATIPLPAGCVVGDLAVVSILPVTPLGTMPAGWTQVGYAPGTGPCIGVSYWKNLTAGDIATGSVTYTGTSNYAMGICVIEGATTTGIFEVDAANPTSIPGDNTVSTSAGVTAGMAGIYFGAGAYFATGWLPSINRGTVIQSGTGNGNEALVMNFESNISTAGVQNVIFSQNLTNTYGYYNAVVIISPAVAPIAEVSPPVTPIPLNGPMNFLSLVSEAIDEDGFYHQSYFPSTGPGSGYVRLNGQGNVWIPVCQAGPLMAGLATASDDYTATPIARTGFGAVEAPFGQLDWQPAVPIIYSGAAPAGPPAYLLAVLSVSLGTGAATGAGDSSTYAIPSSAGPVDRFKAWLLERAKEILQP